MSSLYSYSLESVTLAGEMARAVKSGETYALELLLDSLSVLCDTRARDCARPGGKADVESEIQSLLVGALTQDALKFTGEGVHGYGYGGVVDVQHCPLGGLRNKREAASLKRTGARAGWPDLDIRLVCAGGQRLSILMEVKTEKGKLSREQKDRIHDLQDAGFDVVVCYGLSACVLMVVSLLRVK